MAYTAEDTGKVTGGGNPLYYLEKDGVSETTTSKGSIKENKASYESQREMLVGHLDGQIADLEAQIAAIELIEG